MNHDGKPDLVAYIRPQDLVGARRGPLTLSILGATAGGSLFGGKVTVTAK